jgi:hypothetical protein
MLAAELHGREEPLWTLGNDYWMAMSDGLHC